MTPDALTQFLHREIPLTAAMRLSVIRSEAGEIEIAAPLAPNVNLHGTAFAGSLATLGLVSGWLLLHRALEQAALPAQLVAQKNQCQFLAPAREELRGLARLPDADWLRFADALRHKGRARVEVLTEIRAGATLAVTHTGTYVAKR